MTTDSSLEPTEAGSTRQHPGLLATLDQFDRWISSFLFRRSLPPIVEAIYSVPANFFGLVPSLAIGPLWVALLALQDGNGSANDDPSNLQQCWKIDLLQGITILLTIVFLIAWALFQNGSMPLTKIMARKIYYLIAILFNVGLLSYTLLQPDDDPHYNASLSKQAFEHSMYLLFLWPPSILVIVVLKEFSQRPRPIVVDATKKWLDQKSFPYICHFLARAQANESFPSGDATSAAVFAIVLANLRYTNLAWWLLVLACTGRMYFLAHYSLDVVVGSLLAVVLHRVCSVLGLGIENMMWWHPLASTMFLAVYVQTIMKNKQKIA